MHKPPMNVAIRLHSGEGAYCRRLEPTPTLDAQVSVAGHGAGDCSARQFLWRADGFWRAGSDRQPYRRFEGEDGGGVRLADARQGIAVAVIERADLLGVVVPLFNFEP
jgi:hypothetical protein